jgi:uncharacterized protein YbjT (DUF2867 family)
MRIAVAGGTGLVGSYVVEAARAAGHDPVVLARATGVDLRSDAGVAGAVEGVEVIVDVTNPASTRRAAATTFFTEATRRLHTVGAAQGVSRLVTLSIIGIDRVPDYGYYQAKLAHEQAAAAGPLAVTIVRATQFHEFAAQLLGRTRLGPFAVVPVMRIQPIAARTVAALLVETAVSPPTQQVAEVAGPEALDLFAVARAVVRRRHRRIHVVGVPLPGAAGRAMRRGALLPEPGVRGRASTPGSTVPTR